MSARRDHRLPGSTGAAGAIGADAGGISHSLMLQINEHLVLDFVHEQGTTTRPDIAADLGLSAATVSRIVRRLVEQELVRERPGTSQGGRPRTELVFNARSGCVIGIDLGGTKCHGVLADLAGDLLFEDVRPTDDAGGPFATLSEMIDRLIASDQRHGAPVAGVAVGVPAIVDGESGVAIGGPNVHWHGFPIVPALAEQLDVPFVVDNDVNLAALGHAWRGDAKGMTDFAVLSLGTGIGAAIVSDGRLLRGRNSGAGEVGYLVLDRGLLRSPRADDRGSFEVLASGPAIAEIATERLDETSSDSTLRGGDAPLTPEAVFEAATAGDALAMEVISGVADHVAMSIIALGATVDPEVVVLDGSIGRALGPVISDIEALAGRDLPTAPRVLASTLDGEATALGAVAAALDLSRQQREPRRRDGSGEVPAHGHGA